MRVDRWGPEAADRAQRVSELVGQAHALVHETIERRATPAPGRLQDAAARSRHDPSAARSRASPARYACRASKTSGRSASASVGPTSSGRSITASRPGDCAPAATVTEPQRGADLVGASELVGEPGQAMVVLPCADQLDAPLCRCQFLGQHADSTPKGL